MKSILRIISILFLAVTILNFVGCKTSNVQNAETIQESDVNAIQESMQQINSSVKPMVMDIVEGSVPPIDQKITMFYYVQSGDNLSKIAKKIYGSSKEWKKLAEMNDIKNPNQIFAGDFIHYELNASSKIFAEVYENAPMAKIIVQKGDTLSRVSKAVFGRISDWRVLWKQNPQIKDPDKLLVGQEIHFKPKDLTAFIPNTPSSKKPVVTTMEGPLEIIPYQDKITPQENGQEQINQEMPKEEIQDQTSVSTIDESKDTVLSSDESTDTALVTSSTDAKDQATQQDQQPAEDSEQNQTSPVDPATDSSISAQ